MKIVKFKFGFSPPRQTSMRDFDSSDVNKRFVCVSLPLNLRNRGKTFENELILLLAASTTFRATMDILKAEIARKRKLLEEKKLVVSARFTLFFYATVVVVQRIP